ncbi:MAG: LTA synthase family protein, partial [Clostridia bacterium]|nr:LTA synthase family protein [Clostridia bacterium]
SERGQRILMGGCAEILSVFDAVMYFVENSFSTFMDIKSIFQATGDVLTDFKSTIISILYTGFGTILLFQVPFILYLVFRRCLSYEKIRLVKIIVPVLGILLVLTSYVAQISGKNDRIRVTSEYEFDNVVRHYGIIPGFTIDLWHIVFGYEREIEINPEDIKIVKPGMIGTMELNELPVDFRYLAEHTSNDRLKNIYRYLDTLEGSEKNEYTGIFEGKNLIFITAESFTKEAVSEELTPTLYRLMTKGINFNDYYQPAWGGSTSTGEFSIMTGLIPTSKVNSIQETKNKNMWTTVGNMLKSEGYYTMAYHNNTYTYYDRHLTHKNLGYSGWMGMGNGMENGVRWIWPESDDEMFRFTVDKYLDKQPFSIYYITVSGHTNYTPMGNNMCRENWNRVKGLDCSDAVKGYIACNLELEDALSYLMSRLEEEDMLDDTVIAIAADHYPYGLENSAVWQSDRNYLLELFNVKTLGERERDHNALIIWNGELEKREPIVVDEPTYSLDIVPTLCNLFGVDFDSRLTVGRDVFSDTDPLVIWYNRSFMTDKGYYNSAEGKFYPNDGVVIENEEEYINGIKRIINNKFALSELVLSTDIYNQIYKNYQLNSTKKEELTIKHEIM